MPDQPVVHVLHGDDDIAMVEYTQAQISAMGDPAMAEINITRLDGRTCSLDDLLRATSSMPFLVDHRLVILSNPLSLAKDATQQQKLLSLIEKVPPSTQLLLFVDHLLTGERDYRNNKVHWLEKWAQKSTPHTLLKPFRLPVGPKLAEWIQQRARTAGGQFTPQAALVLSGRVGPEPRILEAEVQKLLAYVNYNRPVEPEDVHQVTPAIDQMEDFALVNALRTRNTQLALKMLRIELEGREAFQVLPGIVYQFRNLLLAREILEQGGHEDEIARQLKLHPYVAKLTLEHARRYTLGELEAIYHRLVEVDEEMKTGVMEGELALEVLVTQLTQ